MTHTYIAICIKLKLLMKNHYSFNHIYFSFTFLQRLKSSKSSDLILEPLMVMSSCYVMVHKIIWIEIVIVHKNQ